MKLSNLSKAIMPNNLADTCEITVTPGVFSVSIVEVAGYNQEFNARVTKFVQSNSDHPAAKGDMEFWNDLRAGRATADTLSFLAHVVVADWTLLDDDGEQVPFDAELAMQIFQADKPGKVIASKLLKASTIPSMFQMGDIIKN